MPTYRTTGYKLAEIDAYRAVLYYEAKRVGADIADPKCSATFMMMAAGLNGKSALLERIAQGERVMAVPPPVSMSYPWYSVVENDKGAPIGLWLDAGNVKDLLAHGLRMGERSHRTKKSGEQTVVIEQRQWQVIDVGSDGCSLDVSIPNWLERGVVWRLSLDVIPATEASSVIVAHHDRQLGKITTIEQLEREQRWQVNIYLENLRAAADPKLAEAVLAKALAEDRLASERADPTLGIGSNFNRMVAESTLNSFRTLLDKRLVEGKSPLPEESELEEMVREQVQQMLGEPEKSGSGWYTVREDGMLMCHCWRIRRLTPDKLPDSIYLDATSLEPAPDSFLGSWRSQAIDLQPEEIAD